MAGRKLAVNTTINGVTYEAGTVPPTEVAKEITNPKAWGDKPQTELQAEPEPDDAGEKSSRRSAAKSGDE